MNYAMTLLALTIALMIYMISGGWLQAKDFVTAFRLKLIEHGHKFRQARMRAGLRLLSLFLVGAVAVTSDLQAVHLRPDPKGTVMVEQWVDRGDGWPDYELVPHVVVKDYGVVSRRVVTTAGVTALANAFLNTFEPEIFNYHASGTGGTAEAIGDTALVTEVETRVAGAQTNPSAGLYRSIATVAYTATRTITEHGLFSQLATGGTLWDRSLFTGIPVLNGDSIQYTHTTTFTAGG